MGVMSDLGYHKLDLMQWLLDQNIVEISAFMGTFEKNTSLEDAAACLLKFRNGVIGTLLVSWDFKPDMDNSVTIRCEKGVLIVPAGKPNTLVVRQIIDMDKTEEIIYNISSSDISGWSGSVAAFVHAVENGLPSPIPGTVGRQVMNVLLSAYQSVSSKQIPI